MAAIDPSFKSQPLKQCLKYVCRFRAVHQDCDNHIRTFYVENGIGNGHVYNLMLKKKTTPLNIWENINNIKKHFIQ